LFELIKTLNKSEKRYFKTYASARKTKKNALVVQLFDALEKPNEYNDIQFKKQNANKPFFKNLASEKQHLMKVLLQSLHEFHRSNTSKTILRNHLDSFDLLFQKRQYKLCEKHLLKAKNRCISSGDTAFLPEIYKLLGKLYQHSGNYEKLKALLEEWEPREEEILTRLKKKLKLDLIKKQFYRTSRSVGYPRTKKDRAIYEEIYQESIKLSRHASSTKEKLSLLTIENFYLDTLPDKKPLMKTRAEWIKLAESNPDYIPDNSMQYLVSLNNLANSYDEMGMQKELNATLEKMSAYPKNNLDEEVRTFIYYYNLKLVGLINLGQFTECVSLIPQAEMGMKKLGRWFHPEYKLSFRYLFSYGNFGAGKYQTSLKWVNEILINYPKETLEEYYNFARIFILLIYFELGYEGPLSSELRSANRYFSTRKKLFSLEKIMLGFFKNTLKPEGIITNKKELKILRKQIAE